MKKIPSIILWLIILFLVVTISLYWYLGSLMDSFNQTKLLNVRFPRVLEALITGGVLTLAGQMYQTILNNPLADSFTLGLASGASLGSGLALFFGLSFLWLPLFSIVFSLVTLMLVLSLSAILTRGYPIRMLILLGLMIGALLNSILYLLVLINPRKMNSIANYLFGGFASAEYHDVMIIAVISCVGVMILFSMQKGIKLLQVGELKSQSLGLNMQSVTYIVLIIASIMTIVVVAYVGIIGFIGMIIPQLIRRFYCHYHLGILMLLNILIGGVIMLMADFIGGTILQPIQIPASIIIALLGVPVLFYILITQSKV
ncbi:FecCD family ABC transporter permease [Staphylococcus saccharolyticus]|uniref:FecCD family ABC transporter permease n=1 Tax=Staphylococcus saccharolyticus TaxID=33028 RepID=UPI0032E02F51